MIYMIYIFLLIVNCWWILKFIFVGRVIDIVIVYFDIDEGCEVVLKVVNYVIFLIVVVVFVGYVDV